jgi:hypothetical protein
VSNSWCWRPAASVAATGGAWAVAGAAWHVREKTARKTRAAAGREATRGGCQEQEAVLVGLQRRRRAVRRVAGWHGKAWRGQRGRVRGDAVQLRHGTWLAQTARAAQRRSGGGEGLEVDKGT